MHPNPKWVFEPVGPMGGATGNAFVNTLQAGGLSPEAELAREAIQNSCDAAREGNRRVQVDFRLTALRGEKKDYFLKTLGLHRGIGERVSSVRLSAGNCLSTPDRPLHLLFVEDYGTVGLAGDPHDRQSHFHRLLLSVGDSSKAFSSSAMGGSYGYGKAALSMNSRLRTIVAYTAFDPDDSGVSARLMACAYLDAHEFGGQQWTGRAWFGCERNGESLIVDPLCNEEAHSVADRLGFRSRRDGRSGTSILVVDSNIEKSDLLIRGIEDWWWPRLLDEELDVKVEAEGEVKFPQPKRREDLRPFIECYYLAVGRAEVVGSHQKRTRLHRKNDLAPGTLACQVLDPEAAEGLPEDKRGSVALIRSPKMVVQYAPLGRAAPPAVGVFVAGSDVDEILRLAEPPNHDRWDPESVRLELAQPSEKVARELISHIHKRLKHKIRELQSQATPPKPREKLRLEFLERELGALFRPPSRRSVPPGGQSVPIEVHFREGPSIYDAGEGRLVTRGRVALRLRPEAEGDAMETAVQVRIPLLEDDRGRAGDPLPLTLESNHNGVARASGSEPELRMTIFKDRWVVFEFRSDPYELGWSTQVEVEVIPNA